METSANNQQPVDASKVEDSFMSRAVADPVLGEQPEKYREAQKLAQEILMDLENIRHSTLRLKDLEEEFNKIKLKIDEYAQLGVPGTQELETRWTGDYKNPIPPSANLDIACNYALSAVDRLYFANPLSPATVSFSIQGRMQNVILFPVEGYPDSYQAIEMKKILLHLSQLRIKMQTLNESHNDNSEEWGMIKTEFFEALQRLRVLECALKERSAQQPLEALLDVTAIRLVLSVFGSNPFFRKMTKVQAAEMPNWSMNLNKIRFSDYPVGERDKLVVQTLEQLYKFIVKKSTEERTEKEEIQDHIDFILRKIDRYESDTNHNMRDVYTKSPEDLERADLYRLYLEVACYTDNPYDDVLKKLKHEIDSLEEKYGPLGALTDEPAIQQQNQMARATIIKIRTQERARRFLNQALKQNLINPNMQEPLSATQLDQIYLAVNYLRLSHNSDFFAHVQETLIKPSLEEMSKKFLSAFQPGRSQPIDLNSLQFLANSPFFVMHLADIDWQDLNTRAHSSIEAWKEHYADDPQALQYIQQIENKLFLLSHNEEDRNYDSDFQEVFEDIAQLLDAPKQPQFLAGYLQLVEMKSFILSSSKAPDILTSITDYLATLPKTPEYQYLQMCHAVRKIYMEIIISQQDLGTNAQRIAVERVLGALPVPHSQSAKSGVPESWRQFADLRQIEQCANLEDKKYLRQLFLRTYPAIEVGANDRALRVRLRDQKEFASTEEKAIARALRLYEAKVLEQSPLLDEAMKKLDSTSEMFVKVEQSLQEVNSRIVDLMQLLQKDDTISLEDYKEISTALQKAEEILTAAVSMTLGLGRSMPDRQALTFTNILSHFPLLEPHYHQIQEGLKSGASKLDYDGQRSVGEGIEGENGDVHGEFIVVDRPEYFADHDQEDDRWWWDNKSETDLDLETQTPAPGAEASEKQADDTISKSERPPVRATSLLQRENSQKSTMRPRRNSRDSDGS